MIITGYEFPIGEIHNLTKILQNDNISLHKNSGMLTYCA